MKISKIYLRICSLLFACFLVCGSILRPVVTYASPYDLMINTDSNALMTLELDDDDYWISPLSTLGTVSNTINSDIVDFFIRFYDGSGVAHTQTYQVNKVNGRYQFSIDLPDGCYIDYYSIDLKQRDLPSPGSYNFSFDLASHFSYDLRREAFIWYAQAFNNASSVNGNVDVNSDSFSGDVYISPSVIGLGNVRTFSIICYLDTSQRVNQIGGSFAIHFAKTNESGPTVGYDTSTTDYENDVSSSLSDLSSSVDSMTEDLSSAAENLEYISTSQNLIIQGIDNVVMHISDQLFAFWNQLFNLIHVPTMAKMDDIIDAINNMDLEIEVNLDGLKTTINNMSTAVQNKLQSTTDQIIGGYDNSGLASDKSDLDGVLNQYEQAEEDLFDDAKGNINDFEFYTPLEHFTGPLSDVSYFLSGLFEAMGPMNVIITFSLTLTIAMVMIGWYRFKGGR